MTDRNNVLILPPKKITNCNDPSQNEVTIPTAPSIRYISDNNEESHNTSIVLNYILVFIVVILLTIVLNTNFPRNKQVVVPKTVVVTHKTILKKETNLINLSNNEKASLLLVLPFGAVLLVGARGLASARRESKKNYI